MAGFGSTNSSSSFYKTKANEKIDPDDNFALINQVLKNITNQPTLTPEDRRVITHLNECLFQLNLKKRVLGKTNTAGGIY